MRPAVIGIHGLSRVGKDTVANFIISKYFGYRYGLADPIKAMLSAGLGIHMDAPYWSSRKEEIIPALGKSPRQMMQTLGTEWGRQLVHTNLWVTLARDQLLRRGPGMIVSDIRFENEATWVRDIGGVIIHVVRGDAPAVSKHLSENSIVRDPQDRVLLNNSSLEDLRHATHELLDGLMGSP
jgi:hypothetical protein